MDQRNLLLAIVVSVSILLGYQFLVEQPRLERERAAQQAAEAERKAAGETVETARPATPLPEAPGAVPALPGVPDGTAGVPGAPVPAAASEPRVQIVSDRVTGSLSLKGARIDDLLLTDYRETLDEDSPQITLFRPPGAGSPYFAQFGWVSTDPNVATPSPQTVWTATKTTLEPESPVVLTWNNGGGLTFTQEIALDPNYMFRVTQRVTNRAERAVALRPYGLISRTDTPDVFGFWILHEGLLGVFGETLKEVDYDDVSDADDGRIAQTSVGGWIGITDKYWLAALIPDQKESIASRFVYTQQDRRDKYQVDTLGEQQTVLPGATIEVSERLFAGAKEVRLLDAYEEDLGIVNFDLAVDFGWFYFLTKPIFYVLEYFNRMIGNFGVAILLLTVLIKIAFFPLANKSYRAMSRLKKLQPEMMKIRDRFKEDRQRQNQEMMALYKKENANPVSGCFPILIQIPVFFALYKVLFVSIEMRHAPFFGWIQDLVGARPARDPDRVRAHRVVGAGDTPDREYRHLAAHYGRDDVPAAKAEPAAGRSDAGQDLPDAAHRLYLHAGAVPSRSGDLLGVEQPALHRPAMDHHAPDGRHDVGADRRAAGRQEQSRRRRTGRRQAGVRTGEGEGEAAQGKPGRRRAAAQAETPRR